MNDNELKQLIAKMLPGRAKLHPLHFRHDDGAVRRVRDTELLHLCSLVEDAACDSETSSTVYFWALLEVVNPKGHHDKAPRATWQQRVTALAKVKGLI
jgi:hypothetical protein